MMLHGLTKAFHNWNYYRKTRRIGQEIDANPSLTALFNETVAEARMLTGTVGQTRGRDEKRTVPFDYLLAALVGRADDDKHARDMMMFSLVYVARRQPRATTQENLQKLRDDFRAMRQRLEAPMP